MGLIHSELTIRPTRRSTRVRALRFLIDSGAAYSVVPREDLAGIGIRPNRNISIVLADGTCKERKVGDAFFEFRGTCAPAPVIFGEADDEPLLGAVTLQALGLVLDPLSRRIYRKDWIRI
jgi:predicted aspartyl protease